tara:strand:+ start:464 stop:679 length:216 start_codon:yes stop_codon:yes gene_type:complete
MKENQLKEMEIKKRAVEVCRNLEQTINKVMSAVLANKNPMFEKPTASSAKLKTKQKEIMSKYKITKKDLKI